MKWKEKIEEIKTLIRQVIQVQSSKTTTAWQTLFDGRTPSLKIITKTVKELTPLSKTREQAPAKW